MVGEGERRIARGARERERAAAVCLHIVVDVRHEVRDGQPLFGDLLLLGICSGGRDRDVDARRARTHVRGAQLCGEHEGSVLESVHVFAVGQVVRRDRLFQLHAHRVARPDIHGDEPVLRLSRDGHVVDIHGKARRPCGSAQAQHGRTAVDFYGRRIRIFKIRRLREGDGIRLIRRAEIERDIHGIARIVVDAVVEFGKALHAAARAAPEVCLLRRIDLEVAARHGLEVGRHARFGILRRPDGVVIGALVVVEIFHISRDCEQRAREFEHVVGVARLAVAVGALGVQHIVRAEVLPLRIAARDIGVPLGDARPERLRHFEVAGGVHRRAVRKRPAVQRDVAVERADDLRDGRVRMLAVEVIFTRGEHLVEQRLLVEHMRGFGVLLLARGRIEVVEGVVHAAVFDCEHGRLGLLAPLRNAVIHPVAEVFRNEKRLRAARKRIGVEQARQNLVHGVPGHPRLGRNVRAVLLHVVELDLHVGGVEHLRAPQKAVLGARAGVVLAFRKFVDDIVEFGRERRAVAFGRARVGDRLRQRGEVVPHRVPADERALPAARVHGMPVRAERGVQIEPREQSVCVQF